MSEHYVSPIDAHEHHSVRGRQECAVCTLELERDAAMNVLREFVERVATAAAVSLTWDEADQVGEPGTPKYNDRLIAEVETALTKRDRLRAAFEGVQALLDERTDRWALAIAERDTAEAERDQLRAKAEEADVELTEFVNLITPLLHGTANALKGEPPPLVWHDWSDLPKVAADLVTERDRLRESVARHKAFAESEILDRVSAELGVDLRRQLEKGT